MKITPDEQVKVLDFGLAKLNDPNAPNDPNAVSNSPTLSMVATQAGIILGTAAYMSPEQAKGAAVDHRSDVFSFGSVLYEMLTGRPPFKGDTAAEILASVLCERQLRTYHSIGYIGSMKVKTSITLSEDIAKTIDRITRKGESRSQTIERLLRDGLAKQVRQAAEQRELAAINEHADQLNAEAEDVLTYQVPM